MTFDYMKESCQPPPRGRGASENMAMLTPALEQPLQPGGGLTQLLPVLDNRSCPEDLQICPAH